MLAFCFALSFAAEPVPDAWPQWRGPTRDAKVAGPAWPANLAGLKPAWRIDLAEGYPGPIVVGDRVFVAETRNKKTEHVRALSRTDGKELWCRSWDGAMAVPFFAARNGSWIRATPACDGARLYVSGMCDELVAFDVATGEERWRRVFHQESGKPAFGACCSPLVDGGALYIQAGNAVHKLDAATGKQLWRTLPNKANMMDGGAFSSPALATLGGKRQLLVQNRSTLAGVELDGGAVLWQQPVPAYRGMNILTPQVFGDAVFTSSYQQRSFLYKVAGAGTNWQVSTAWENKSRAYMSSPVVVGDHAYVHLESQRIACFDLRTGETKWTSTDRFGEYWSMAANGDSILALDQKGELVLLRANPQKFEVLDRRKVSEQETWGHLAVVGRELYIRELKGLIRLDWADAPAK
jgi:outer membrane protein assembly factor BamB